MSAETTEGFEVLEVKLLPPPKPNVHTDKAMSLVNSADYMVSYQEGIEVCSDCGATLVDELPADDGMEVLARIADEDLANRLVEYLEYSSMKAVCVYDEQEQMYSVKVDKDKIEKAKVAFRGFYIVNLLHGQMPAGRMCYRG